MSPHFDEYRDDDCHNRANSAICNTIYIPQPAHMNQPSTKCCIYLATGSVRSSVLLALEVHPIDERFSCACLIDFQLRTNNFQNLVIALDEF